MLMKPTGNLDEVMDELLAELRKEHRAVEAPALLELTLSAEAEAKAISKRPAPVKRIWAWGLSFGLLAAVVVAAVEWEIHRVHAPESRQVQAEEHVAPVPGTQVPTQAEQTAAVRHSHARSVKGDIRRTSPKISDPQEVSEEASLDDFVPLPASEGLPPVSAISLVRMQIEQSALQQYGLEVPAEAAPRTLLAEFVVGDDGLPRAIRIIP
jgi:hypothetical protein